MFQKLTKDRILKTFCYLALLQFVFIIATPSEAQRDENTVAGIWTFDDGTANDTSNQNLNGTIVGAPESVSGIAGKALKFNGVNDGIKIPDSPRINITNSFNNRTVAALFNCDDVSKDQKQVIFEEGGQTRGLAIYVFEGKLYVGGWNRNEYNWAGSWPSVEIESNKWYHVGLVLRDVVAKVEADKFEVWLDGKLIIQEEGGQLNAHADDNGIGHLNQNSFYHDGGRATSNADWFGGLIDEVIVYNSAFNNADFAKLAQPLSVDPEGKTTTTWANLKTKSVQ